MGVGSDLYLDRGREKRGHGEGIVTFSVRGGGKGSVLAFLTLLPFAGMEEASLDLNPSLQAMSQTRMMYFYVHFIIYLMLEILSVFQLFMHGFNSEFSCFTRSHIMRKGLINILCFF